MNVDNELITEMLAEFKKLSTIENVKLFGSRARGDNIERSNYDLAVYGSLSVSEKLRLRSIMNDNLRTLHKIDVVFMNEKLPPRLIANIENDGIQIYGRDE